MSSPILAAFDPQSKDPGPARFALAAARFSGAPVLIVSICALPVDGAYPVPPEPDLLPEAEAAADRGLGFAPANLDLIEAKVMVRLAQGDLEGARTALRATRGAVDPTALVAFMATYWDLYWALDDEQQQMVLRLTPAAYDGDEGTLSIVRAETYWARGDTARARVAAESARVAFLKTLEAAPDDSQRLLFLALALAYLGRGQEAIRTAERGLTSDATSRDNYTGTYLQHVQARVYLLAGEQDRALAQEIASARETLAEVPCQAGVPGDASGRQRRQGR